MVQRRYCPFSVGVEKQSLQVFHPFLDFSGQCILVLLMLPAQQCRGSAVLPCCEASVRLSQPLFPAVTCGFPCVFWIKSLPCLFFVGTDTLGSRFDPESMIQTSIQIWEAGLAYSRYLPFQICVWWGMLRGSAFSWRMFRVRQIQLVV